MSVSSAQAKKQAQSEPRLDYSTLTAPVSRAQIRALKASLADSTFAKPEAKTVASSVATVVLVPLVALLLVATISLLITSLLNLAFISNLTIAIVSDIIGVAGLLALAAYICFRIFKRDVAFGRPLRKWARLDRFSQAHGWRYLPYAKSPALPGMIFQVGKNREATDIIQVGQAMQLDFGNFRCMETSQFRGERRARWGYMRYRLPRRLPHMVLEARSNRRFGQSTMPASFKRAQTLSLEGDFNKYFTLYAPVSYERDALYVFAPDLMALLIDHAAPFDVEIIDDQLFIYSRKPFDMLDPATYDLVDRLVATIGRKTWTQTERYSDDRAGIHAGHWVDVKGRRLRRSVSIWAGVAFVLWILLRVAGPVLQALGHQ